MLACHAGGPGSIPGRCKVFYPYSLTECEPNAPGIAHMRPFRTVMAKTLLKSLLRQVGFRSVVVITLASHARGPGFETQRKQGFIRQCCDQLPRGRCA